MQTYVNSTIESDKILVFKTHRFLALITEYGGKTIWLAMIIVFVGAYFENEPPVYFFAVFIALLLGYFIFKIGYWNFASKIELNLNDNTIKFLMVRNRRFLKIRINDIDRMEVGNFLLFKIGTKKIVFDYSENENIIYYLLERVEHN